MSIHIISKEKETSLNFDLDFSTPEKVESKYLSYILDKENANNILFQCNGVLSKDKFLHNLNIFKSVEDLCAKACENNSLQWFGKQFSESSIESNHSPSYTEGGLSLNTDSDTKLYNKLSKQTDTLPDNSEVTCLLEPKYIWFTRKNWGVHWYLHQAKLVNNFKLKEYAIQDDSDDEVEETESGIEEDSFFSDI